LILKDTYGQTGFLGSARICIIHYFGDMSTRPIEPSSLQVE